MAYTVGETMVSVLGLQGLLRPGCPITVGEMSTVNVLKFLTLYSILFNQNFAFNAIVS